MKIRTLMGELKLIGIADVQKSCNKIFEIFEPLTFYALIFIFLYPEWQTDGLSKLRNVW